MMKRKNSYPPQEHSQYVVMLLEGHLFDSGLINQVLDLLEKYKCGFEFQECYVRQKQPDGGPVKSTAVIKVTGGSDVDFTHLSKKISDLVRVLETAEATIKVFDSDNRPAYVTGDGGGAGGGNSSYFDDEKNKAVLILGSGLVSKSAVDYFGRLSSEPRDVIVASNDEEEARQVAKLAKERGRHVHMDIMGSAAAAAAAAGGGNRRDSNELSKLINTADVVISLLPAGMHPTVARLCIENKTDLVTASYESDEMRSLDEA